jgi:hypothetical protein
MTEIPLPRTKPERMSDIQAPPLPPRERATKAREEIEEPPPARAAVAKRRPAYERGEIIFHMLLPAVSLLLGLTLLFGLLYYVNHGARSNDEPFLSFVFGVVLTGLGGLELLLWQGRLRRLSGFTPPGE